MVPKSISTRRSQHRSQDHFSAPDGRFSPSRRSQGDPRTTFRPFAIRRSQPGPEPLGSAWELRTGDGKAKKRVGHLCRRENARFAPFPRLFFFPCPRQFAISPQITPSSSPRDPVSSTMPPKKFTVPRQADADDSDPTKGKPTPEGWTDEAWLADCVRRKVESDGRRQRAERAQQKRAAAAAKKQAEEAARMKANVDGFHAGARSASGLVFPPNSNNPRHVL